LHLAFNGWPLARSGEPDAGLHLRDLLERLPALAPQHRYTLLLPSSGTLTSFEGVAIAAVPAGTGEWARLWFEQSRLPREAAFRKADLLYFPYPAAPLASPLPVAIWQGCEVVRGMARGPIGRLRAGLGFAGLAGAAARIFSGLGGPTGEADRSLRRIPPMAPRAFAPAERRQDREARGRYDLPETYVLADSAGPGEIGLLLAAWAWVNSTMGDAVTLIVLGTKGAQASAVSRRAGKLGLAGSVRVVEEVRAEDLPAIYRGAEAFLFAGWGCTGEAVRRALASGMAIVGAENPGAAEVVGPAGYLVKGQDARLLGAACITVLAEPEVRDRLRSQAQKRGALLTADAPLRALLGHLEDVVKGGSPNKAGALS